MQSKIRWGIIGCGRIAEKFASDLRYVDHASLEAVASRSKLMAENFGQKFSAVKAYDHYESLMQDNEVDVIYIATPHSFHHEQVLACLNAGKAVLCEKAFAINLKQAKEMVYKAREKQIFLMEALWSKFIPQYKIVEDLIGEGRLGQLQGIMVNFGFIPINPIPPRLYDPALGGGSLLDIGIYNVFLTVSILGRPDQVSACISRAPSGIDEQCTATFQYKNGAIAQLFSTFSANLATEAHIFGNQGRINLSPNYYNATKARVEYFPGHIDSKQIIPHLQEPGFGYQYQIRHVCECLREGLKESPVMSHTDTLLIMETMDRIRELAGLRYPADEFLHF